MCVITPDIVEKMIFKKKELFLIDNKKKAKKLFIQISVAENFLRVLIHEK